MAEGGARGRGCLLAVVGLGLFVLLSCGCAGVLAVVMGPTLLADAMVEDQPLEMEHRASTEAPKSVRERTIADLRSESRTTRLTGPELTTLIQDQLGDRGRGGATIEGGVAELDVSVNLKSEPTDADQWMNIHVRGSLTIKDGWATAASIEELEFSGWDLSAYMEDDAQLLAQINQQMATRRAQEPELAEALDAVESLKVSGDAIELTLTPEGVAKLKDAR